MAFQSLKYHFAKAFQGLGVGSVLTIGALTTVMTGFGVYDLQEAEYDTIGGTDRIEQASALGDQLKDLTILKKTSDIANILDTSNSVELKQIVGNSSLDTIKIDTQTIKDSLFNKTIDFQYNLHKFADIAESDYATLGGKFNALGLNEDWNIPTEEARFLDENRLDRTATNKFDKMHDLKEMRDDIKYDSGNAVGASIGFSFLYAIVFLVGAAFAELENVQGSRRLNRWAADKPQGKKKQTLN